MQNPLFCRFSPVLWSKAPRAPLQKNTITRREILFIGQCSAIKNNTSAYMKLWMAMLSHLVILTHWVWTGGPSDPCGVRSNPPNYRRVVPTPEAGPAACTVRSLQTYLNATGWIGAPPWLWVVNIQQVGEILQSEQNRDGTWSVHRCIYNLIHSWHSWPLTHYMIIYSHQAPLKWPTLTKTSSITLEASSCTWAASFHTTMMTTSCASIASWILTPEAAWCTVAAPQDGSDLCPAAHRTL